MKKILFSLLTVFIMLSCTVNNTNPAEKPVTPSQLYGTWIFKYGYIKPFHNNGTPINHIILFQPNGYYQERTTYLYKDSAHVFSKDTVIPGKWNLSNDTLFITDIHNIDTIIHKVKMNGNYLLMNNNKYVKADSTHLYYVNDIVNSWYQMGCTDNSFYQFKNNGTMIHYHNPITQTEQTDYTWKINDNILSLNTECKDSCQTCNIDFINDQYSKWGNTIYKCCK